MRKLQVISGKRTLLKGPAICVVFSFLRLATELEVLAGTLLAAWDAERPFSASLWHTKTSHCSCSWLAVVTWKRHSLKMDGCRWDVVFQCFLRRGSIIKCFLFVYFSLAGISLSLSLCVCVCCLMVCPSAVTWCVLTEIGTRTIVGQEHRFFWAFLVEPSGIRLRKWYFVNSLVMKQCFLVWTCTQMAGISEGMGFFSTNLPIITVMTGSVKVSLRENRERNKVRQIRWWI